MKQLANHTCCDEHWNANLKVAAIEHHDDTNIVPMAILRARKDIEKDAEILTRYWHKEKDAWQNIFECQCCTCTNQMGTTITTPTETADVTTTEDPVPIVDYTPREIHGSEIALTSHHEGSQDRSARDVEDYPESEMDDIPESEMDDMDWDDLELSPFKETITRNKQRDEKPSPSQNTLPHLKQDTQQRTSEGRQDKSTNHKTGGFLNSINGTHSVATNTTARTM